MATTRGEQMLALRRARMAASPPILRGGFRPLFFGGALWAAIALTLWILAFRGDLTLPSTWNALAWHRHEMLFGFVGAVIAGFLLTAIPNWTGRLPIAGVPLASLVLLWLAGRIAVLFSIHTGPLLAAVLDVGFYLALVMFAGREVIASGNRNLPLVMMLFLFGVANAVDHAGAAGMLTDDALGVRGAIGLVVLMISLIGGRVIPSFTRNWLMKQGIRKGLPDQPGTYDRITLAVTAVAVLTWVVTVDEPIAGWLLLVAAIMQLVRLARWSGVRGMADPLVLILHVGYLWIPVGLALMGAVILRGYPTLSVAIHALTAGAMATMILAIMTRATLGHTGRPLVASGATVAIYLLVSAGALLRVVAPLLPIDPILGMEAAALLWGAAFVLFAIAYGPILFAPRADNPDG